MFTLNVTLFSLHSGQIFDYLMLQKIFSIEPILMKFGCNLNIFITYTVA